LRASLRRVRRSELRGIRRSLKPSPAALGQLPRVEHSLFQGVLVAEGRFATQFYASLDVLLESALFPLLRSLRVQALE
jgi:hypothetical protein